MCSELDVTDYGFGRRDGLYGSLWSMNDENLEKRNTDNDRLENGSPIPGKRPGSTHWVVHDTGMGDF